jgi:hypothetical protein
MLGRTVQASRPNMAAGCPAGYGRRSVHMACGNCRCRQLPDAPDCRCPQASTVRVSAWSVSAGCAGLSRLDQRRRAGAGCAAAPRRGGGDHCSPAQSWDSRAQPTADSAVNRGSARQCPGGCRTERCGSVRCPLLLPERRPVSGRSVSTADAAAACLRCPLLQEPVARPASAHGGQPPAPSLPDLLTEPLAELLAYVGHGRPRQRQRQRLLVGQRAEPEALDVAAAPGGDDRAGGRLRVDAQPGPGAMGQARNSTVRSARNTSSCGWRSGWPVTSSYSSVPAGWGTAGSTTLPG